MNRLRELLADLIGAEVQPHTITLNGKAATLHFRQFDDATGERIFALVPDESASDRGTRLMKSVIAASVCDEAGNLVSSEAEVADLPAEAIIALFEAASKTNNINFVKSTPASSSVPDDSDPGDEAAAEKKA